MAGLFDGDNLKGIFGCFINPENNWVDCLGPFFIGEWSGDDAKGMFEFANAKLPKAVRFNFYFDSRNRNLHRMMESLSAQRRDNEYILLLEKLNYKPQQIKHNIVSYSDEFENDVIQILHDTFPDSYISGRELISSIGKDRDVFCALNENGVFVGYGVLKRYKDNPDHMTAEIFAVAEGARGEGYGWALLNMAVDCALNRYNADTVDLVVDKLNTHASDLYYSCGFKLMAENSSYCIKN
ncbi:MAG: GNAT family N-acetyltransferase [Defluviitaleaceae bacterium]|nr:GNAT family N-acetyltransferase [Defluviitaleaceae bacterium]